jgi:ketosteroid isomerase-like protein
MTSADLETVRQLYEDAPRVERRLVAGEDLREDPWLLLWHPDCVLEDLSDIPDTGSYRGREGIVGFFRRAFTEVWDEWRFTPLQVLQGDTGVVAEVENTATSKTGIAVEVRLFQVFHFRDGLIAHAAGYLDREPAFRAAGVGPPHPAA